MDYTRYKGVARQTAEMGAQVGISKIASLGGLNIQQHKEGNMRYLTFETQSGRRFKVTIRTRKTGSWQTMLTYGEFQTENLHEDHYWLFVDVGSKPPKFYPVPFWWIANNIKEAHEEYLSKHGGHRKFNDSSKHHAIRLSRIKSWEENWQFMSSKS